MNVIRVHVHERPSRPGNETVYTCIYTCMSVYVHLFLSIPLSLLFFYSSPSLLPSPLSLPPFLSLPPLLSLSLLSYPSSFSLSLPFLVSSFTQTRLLSPLSQALYLCAVMLREENSSDPQSLCNAAIGNWGGLLYTNIYVCVCVCFEI